MLKPSVELTRDLDISTYSLVVGLAKKARDIVEEADKEKIPLDCKPVEKAVQMYNHHDFKIVETEPCPVCGRLDCICEKPSPAPVEDIAEAEDDSEDDTEDTL